jgi:hypothetical protein
MWALGRSSDVPSPWNFPVCIEASCGAAFSTRTVLGHKPGTPLCTWPKDYLRPVTILGFFIAFLLCRTSTPSLFACDPCSLCRRRCTSALFLHSVAPAHSRRGFSLSAYISRRSLASLHSLSIITHLMFFTCYSSCRPSFTCNPFTSLAT